MPFLQHTLISFQTSPCMHAACQDGTDDENIAWQISQAQATNVKVPHHAAPYFNPTKLLRTVQPTACMWSLRSTPYALWTGHALSLTNGALATVTYSTSVPSETQYSTHALPWSGRSCEGTVRARAAGVSGLEKGVPRVGGRPCFIPRTVRT